MFFRKHKKLIILAVIFFTAAAAGTAGFIIAQSEPRIVEEKEQAPVPAGADGARIARSAKIVWNVDYKMCGHSITLETEADDNMIGLSFSQFCEKYPDLRIMNFTPLKIELKVSYNCYCPEHFVLKKNGDMLSVFRTAPGTDKQDLYINTQIYYDDIKQDERKPMEIGRVFGSFEELEAYIVKLIEYP